MWSVFFSGYCVAFLVVYLIEKNVLGMWLATLGIIVNSVAAYLILR